MPRSAKAYLAALAGASLSVALVSIACGSEYTPSGEPIPLSTSQPNERVDASSQRDGDSVLEASPTKLTYKGTLAAAPKVKFGGDPYCNYEVDFKQIAIEVGTLENGEVGHATVTNLHVETALAPCPYAPAQPSIHNYTLASATNIASGRRLYFEGAKSNQPKASLTIDLVPKNTGFDATATWTRTDQKPALTWIVTAKVPLERK